MKAIANVFSLIGAFIWWVVQKFLPFIIKKFGVIVVKSGIQKTISALVILITVAFYVAVFKFISDTYTMFRSVVAVLNDPTANALGGGAGSQYLSCFMNLLHASGIAAGFNAAASFGISVLIFFFLRGLYAFSLKISRAISDEVSKSLKLV